MTDTMTDHVEIDARATRYPESDDRYPGVVAVLNQHHRLIRCRDGVQWILQRRHGPERLAGTRWDGRSYCRTREALIRCCREHAGAIDPAAQAILATLPDRIETEDRRDHKATPKPEQP